MVKSLKTEGPNLMNINIPIPEQIEAALRRKAATYGQGLDEYIQHLIAEEAVEELPVPPQGESADVFMTRLRSMVERHAVRCGHVDDSRESIYAGRGE
jgi:hypothetical protein